MDGVTGGEGDSNPPIEGNALAQELLREGQPVCLIARGWSMWPVLRDGDRVEIVPVRPEDLQLGEIGAWVESSPASESGGLVLHRLIRWERAGRIGIFQGDACPASDAPVAAERIVGRVSACWRRGKRVRGAGWGGRLALLLQPLWRALFAAAAAGLRFYRGGPSLLPGSGVRAARERALLAFTQREWSHRGVTVSPFAGVDEVVATVLEDPAYQHLIPLVARGCRLHPIEGLNSDLQKRLLAEEDRALFYSAQTEGLLRHLADVLRRAGQELLVVKGTALAFTGVYAEPHLRQGADVDTLCLPGQERLLTDLLLQNGFENVEPEYPLEYYLRYRSEVALFRRSAPRWPTLEVHWTAGGSLFYGRRLKAERLWQ
ncbi:MAG TPA: nucleotidyltransferase family protein, partial [Candidatus Sumerlaeota bacterium]|nr:nucleotidyltransferase family protein [Candidatus Sumerlaeota bacterium]